MDRINTMAEVLVQRGCEQIFSQAASGAFRPCVLPKNNSVSQV
jgi:hypothetical protein